MPRADLAGLSLQVAAVQLCACAGKAPVEQTVTLPVEQTVTLLAPVARCLATSKR